MDRTLKIIRWITALGLVMLGAPLLWGGVRLVLLGGSFYYTIAGLTLLAAAVFAWRGESRAIWLYALLTAGTMIWAVAEVGFDCWALLPRVAVLAVLGAGFGLPFVRRALGGARIGWAGPALLAVALALCGLSFVGKAFMPASPAGAATASPIVRGDDWPLYGNTERGDRFSPARQITRDNVGQLKLAWSYRSGIKPPPGTPPGMKLTFEATPIKIGGGLYVCTPYNQVISLNADTGAEQWRFDPGVRGPVVSNACRGVSYYAGSGTKGFCDSRILMATIDNRLHALDPATGRFCTDFGTNGVVDLKVGMGDNPPGYQFATSPPLVMGDAAVVGGSHLDNQSTDEMPGVIRAFDVHSGRLLWAWEVLTPQPRQLEPVMRFARDTPNAWSVFSADSQLGLIFIPTGGAPPDFFGGLRSAAQGRYSNSIVALDAATGEVRWSFQAVHHDLWDLDMASQPVLVDIETAQGQEPALIAPTKRGEIFVLDRRTGRPIVSVIEKTVPQRGVAGERCRPRNRIRWDFRHSHRRI